MTPWDVTVIGGGVLGTSLAYWLSQRYDSRILVLEGDRLAAHASGRNTGVVHRPFYLDPQTRGFFARVAQASYFLWRKFAADHGLPWEPVGTLKIAMTPEEVGSLEKNVAFARANGMEDAEYAILDREQVHEIEPNVRCHAGLIVHTDTVVDYRLFTEALMRDAQSLGATYYANASVTEIRQERDGLLLKTPNAWEEIRTRFLVNCAGGGALDIAHALGVGPEYADLHFRGEYWVIGKRAASMVSRNVYTVPKQGDLPFLDPHWIVRPNGQREIGPNAVPVPEKDSYGELMQDGPKWLPKAFEPPIANKLRLVLSKEFLTLSAREVLSSLSRGEMARRVQSFIPRLREEDLVARGPAGIRSPVIDRKGKMVKEAIELAGPMSYHVLNFNSPGATGAPAYTAHLVDTMASRGYLDHLKRAEKPPQAWAWAEAAGLMGLAS